CVGVSVAVQCGLSYPPPKRGVRRIVSSGSMSVDTTSVGVVSAAVAASPRDPPIQPNLHLAVAGEGDRSIPFAPLAFAPQRQKRSSAPLSPPTFLPTSTHFTAPPEVPH